MKYDTVLDIKRQIKAGKSKWKDIADITPDKIIKKKSARLPFTNLVSVPMLVFCVPDNADLLAYWNRVEDRMYKIRYRKNT